MRSTTVGKKIWRDDLRVVRGRSSTLRVVHIPVS
jgi:hypothetical protein